jgi:TolB-like protein/Tfp pilus assembly protein PilF
LDSWKDVAAYLKRDVSTVQRWERREGLPIHRHQHDKLGSVYAFRHELDQWREARSHRGEPLPASGDVVDAGGPEAARPPVADVESLPAVAGDARRRRAGTTVVAAAALAIAVAGWWGLRPGPGDPAVARPDIRSIVVLPIENLSGDPAQDVFAAGLTEEITARLAQVRSLRVVSRTSAMSLPRRQLSVAAIAEQLDVDALIEGSVRQERERVRITVQLIHAPTDRHVWVRDFERAAGARLDLQIEVADAIVAEIGAATPEEQARLASIPRGSPEAHEEYLLGRHLLWKFIEDDRVLAIGHFQRATALDPAYAAPYAALAHAWWMRGVLGPLSLKEVAGPARDAALAALARDDRNGEAHAALAYVQGMFDRDWPTAERTIRRAIELEPNRVDARYVHALLLMAMGRLPESAAAIDVAARLDPLGAQVHSTYGQVLFRARRFDESEAHLRRALELEPRNPATYLRLGHVLAHRGRSDQAFEVLDQASGLLGSDALAIAFSRARALAILGRADEARRLVPRIPVGPARAEVLALLGDRDAAFAALFHALDGQESWPLFVKADPNFERLHDDPRWTAVLERMNLEN